MNKFIKEIENILKSSGIEEYKQETKLLIKELNGKSFEELLISDTIENQEKIKEIATLRAQTKKPIQHLLGYSYFMGEKYIVNKNVLIPRDETEILVEHCFELLKNKKEKINILDIGLGSGCISCALAKKLLKNNQENIEILGIDVSFEALEVALKNINELNLIRKIIIRKSDLFSKIRDCEKFDLIVSNPPYIPFSEKENLQNEVKNFEPHLALFAPDKKGIEFYKKIIQNANNYLKKNGFIAFELGINQSQFVKEILEKNNFKNIQIIKDLTNINRVISANFA